MNQEQNNLNKISTPKEGYTEDNSNQTEVNSPFLFDSIETPLKKLKKGHYSNRIERNNLILDVIRIHHPISKYKLAKITKISYNCIKQVTKEFAFCGLIIIKNSISENNIPVKLITLKENEK